MKTSTLKQAIIISTIAILMFSLNACKKEDSITPNTPTTPTAPTSPTVPVVPAVSVKPTNISTTENGVVVRNQNFIYDKLEKPERMSKKEIDEFKKYFT